MKKILFISFLFLVGFQVSIGQDTLEGVIIEQLVNKQQLPSGSYHYAVSIGSPGTYLVVYTKNGTTSVKKVIIN